MKAMPSHRSYERKGGGPWHIAHFVRKVAVLQIRLDRASNPDPDSIEGSGRSSVI